ncbi:ABC transporter permease [Lacticaseibacillus zhaodongensis]|uniref:ABC transporter permease n=1 Tax=Lacticaseibacillus zhaodongensis TaxID=2668065 RepID=UPI0012D31DC0|nr:ABC transporter permease [Lacticaseibacillus zhaodongensis]
MQNKMLNRMLRRTIKDTKGRFIAITLIIMLGVLIFVGVKGIGPGYRDSATRQLDSARLEDLAVSSTAGLTKKDVARAKRVKGVTVAASKSTFALAQGDESVVNVLGYRNNRGLNRLIMRSGHLPQQRDQIVLDQHAREYGNYKLGGRFTLKPTKTLRRRSYTIVGFADSPLYINNNYDRGNANIGSGTVAYFAYTQQRNLKLNVYTSIALRLKQRPAGDTYGAAYKHAVASKRRDLQRAFAGRASARRTELRQQALAPLAKQQAQLDAQKAKLTQAQQAAAGMPGAAATLTAQSQQLAAAQRQLTSAHARVVRAIPKVDFTYAERSDLIGFSDYGSSADRIAAIGDVFPVFFFLIAALITFTTVSRMVTEDRTQLGTLKALGYSGAAIARNYFLYGLFAAIIGTILGVLIGQQGLVRFVLLISKANIFTTQVILPQWGDIGLATLMALLATVGAVAVVAPSELATKPAELMLPKAPKNGKKILLERIRPLWRRFSFNTKVSMRNLFRFKSRMFMTIIGIAGGAGLILTGFGIRDSIVGSSAAQFGGVLRYQATVRLDKPASASKAKHVLRQNAAYKSTRSAASDVVTLARKGNSVASVTMIAPSSSKNWREYVRLDTMRGRHIQLPKRGVVLTQKAADILHAQTGSRISVKNSAGRSVSVRVAAVSRNYTGHFLYMSPAAYQHTWGKPVPRNSLLVKTKHMRKSAERQLARQLLSRGGAVNTSYMSDSLSTIQDMSKSLNSVVLIMILLSGLLSFVVLYNLTNINVSERMRELSTIKVLGFYDGEVTLYVGRENIVLTIVGIICSFGVGQVLTRFILQQAASDTIVFPVIIGWEGYVAATILTAVFTAIVMYVTHVRLKHVDMLEALAARE